MPNDGTITLDRVTLELAPQEGGGFQWTPHTQAILPGVPQPEEAQVGRAPREHTRTYAWLDFSGGQGASKVVPGYPTNRTHYSEGASGEYPGRLVRGQEIRTVTPANGGGSVTDFFEIASTLYAVIGPTWRKLTLTLNAETCAARATDGATNATADGGYVSTAVFTEATPLWYDGTSTKVFLGTTDAADPAVSFDGTNGVQDNATFWGYSCLSEGNDGQRLWVSSCPTDSNGVYVANIAAGQNPFAQAIGTSPWSGRFPGTANEGFGNRSAAITDIATLRNGVIVTTADGQVYMLDFATGRATPLLDADGLVPASTAGKQMGVWNGVLVVPAVRGLMLYDEESDGPGVFKAIGPMSLHGHEMPVRDNCTAMYKGDPEWLYVNFYDGTNSWVWKGRQPRKGEFAASRLIWECVAKIASKQVTALHITHLGTNPILVCGTATPDLHFVTLPRIGLAPIGANSDGNCRSRITSHKVFLPDLDGGAPTTQEVFRTARFKVKDVSASEYVNVAVRVDRGNYYAAGRIENSPIASISLPIGTEGSSIGVELDFLGTTALATFPQIEAIEIDASESAEPSSWVDVTFQASRDRRTSMGQNPRSARAIREFLRDLASQVRPIECVGPDNEALTVKVDPYFGVHEVQVKKLPKQESTYGVRCRLNVYSEDSGEDLIWDQGNWAGAGSNTRWTT